MSLTFSTMYSSLGYSFSSSVSTCRCRLATVGESTYPYLGLWYQQFAVFDNAIHEDGDFL